MEQVLIRRVCAIEQERCFVLYFLSCLCMARIVFSIIARFLSIVPWLSLYFLQGLLGFFIISQAYRHMPHPPANDGHKSCSLGSRYTALDDCQATRTGDGKTI